MVKTPIVDTTFDEALMRNNILARIVAFGVLAPLTLYLAKPDTFPQAEWPRLLTVLWAFSLLAGMPLIAPKPLYRHARLFEAAMVYAETVIAGVWASTFGFDVVCIWGVIAAGVFNNVAVRGYVGFAFGVVGAAVGLAIGGLWFDLEPKITMNLDVAIVVLPLFLLFMLLAEGTRMKLVNDIMVIKQASDARADEIKILNQQIREQVLARYLPPALIDDIFAGKTSMDTKPSSRQVTVLFSDLT
ncbi:MAG: hypothetical protein VX223_16430, partial [Myxococcota bacterium]|nr:hypothetical protein [Myxococcota bacterium]